MWSFHFSTNRAALLAGTLLRVGAITLGGMTENSSIHRNAP
jgi:hypothetical protein